MKQDVRELVITGHNEIARIEKFVEEICDFYNVNNDYFGNILLATTEAAEILFSLNDTLNVDKLGISFERTRKGMIFKIKLVKDSKFGVIEEDLLEQEIRRHKLSREIFIIKALTDEITISVNAKSIILVFYVSSINYEKSLYRINQLKEYWIKMENVIQKK